MAEAFLQVLLESMSSLIEKEIGLIMGVDKEMKKLQSTLSTIQSVLEDAEFKQSHSEPIQNWVSKLNDAAYEIEDLLDECATEISRFERNGVGVGVGFNLKKILFSHKIGRRMKAMAEKLDDLAAERRNFHLRELTLPNSSDVDCRRETGTILNEADLIYGRDGDREKMVDVLVNQVAECEHLSVLPIIGVGGLGKTTLAQLVFNEERVSRCFDTKIWVSVSDNFEIKVLLRKIIEFATGSATDLTQIAALQLRVRELVNRRRYLLVLDDVWNENQDIWAMFKSVLDCGSKGSSIVVTTRMQKVAEIMGTAPSHFLEGLSEESCWLLFKARAFGKEGTKQSNLESIGKRIVRKCVGVPLVAKALGGLLRFKREEKEWIHVEKSEIWNLPINETVIFPVLRLSYHHLPLQLRRCFVHCAVFPKDSTMEKRELIFHWMAHGCISSNGANEVEDVGDQVWNELVLRSFFQEVDTRGRETIFKMHDLVHDLAQSIMENKVPRAQRKSKIREVYLSKSSWDTSSSITLKVPTLSNIISYDRLRILKLNWARLETLPSEIGKLKHLRYLDLTHSSIQRLPSTFCSLWNLQILILDGCSYLETLPKHIRFMTNLRHISLDGCSRLSDMPSKIRELICLRTLSLFIVGHKVDNQLDQLQLLNLEGRLELRHLERTKNHLIAKKANLVEKPNLRCLILSWEGDSAKAMDEKVLEALEPHTNLETLEISGFKGSCFPVWLTKMKNLTSITVRNCQNCSPLPLGYHPRLKSLHLWMIDGLEYMMNHYEIFPSLVEVSVSNLPNLKGFVAEELQGETPFPNLRLLHLEECKLLTLPSLVSNVEGLTVWRCSPLTVSSLSKVRLLNLTYLDLNFGDDSRACCTEEEAWPLSNLKELRIWQAREEHFPENWFRGLKSLTRLDMRQCSIRGLHHLISLEELYINGSSDLEEVVKEIKELRLLKRLSLWGVGNVASLPEDLQHLSSLQSLTLGMLPQLSLLPPWLPNLVSLVDLIVLDCPKLTSFPSTMANLSSLTVSGCPELERRCEKGKGEDWHKVALIPRLHI